MVKLLKYLLSLFGAGTKEKQDRDLVDDLVWRVRQKGYGMVEFHEKVTNDPSVIPFTPTIVCPELGCREIRLMLAEDLMSYWYDVKINFSQVHGWVILATRIKPNETKAFKEL